MNKKKLIEAILAMQKRELKKNTDLIDMEGSSPDLRLIETGKVKQGLKKDFTGRREIDLKNERFPSH